MTPFFKTNRRIFIWILIASLILSALSILQKLIIQAKPEAFYTFKGYVVPLVYGVIVGLIIGLYLKRIDKLTSSLKNKNITLENTNKKITILNKQLRESIIQLGISKEKAESAHRLQTQFLENISHEIRTPMNGIVGFSGLLEYEKSEPKRREYLNHINISCHNLINVIDGILDISRIQCNQVQINKIPTETELLLDNLNDTFSALGKQKGIRYNYLNKLPKSEKKILTDPIIIDIILHKLLDNAFKYTKEGSVTLIVEQTDDKLIFRVIDTGIGIKQEYFETIFKRFKNLNHEQAALFGGLGLGLAVVKAHTELLGGKIELKSELNKGSEFRLILPLEYSQKIETTHAINSKSNKCAILVAEDDDTSILLIKEIIDNDNCEIRWAKNGIEALKLYKQYNDFKLIITDIKMPQADGFYLIKAIRKLDKTIPIIVQTAFTSGDEIALATEYGANDFLNKPFTQEKLIEKISPYIQNYNN